MASQSLSASTTRTSEAIEEKPIVISYTPISATLAVKTVRIETVVDMTPMLDRIKELSEVIAQTPKKLAYPKGADERMRQAVDDWNDRFANTAPFEEELSRLQNEVEKITNGL